jgi:hypothetical protein
VHVIVFQVYISRTRPKCYFELPLYALCFRYQCRNCGSTKFFYFSCISLVAWYVGDSASMLHAYCNIVGHPRGILVMSFDDQDQLNPSNYALNIIFCGYPLYTTATNLN